ncbi:SRPBCC domain-containing protein [Mucilaginibacter mali]|uniref:SRPBCC domain-containing protein n=1 Tax=Mucilaginibacter mali TaxID=2740462 RepID=A0A7D4QFV0_9SPHI|nr:SRPBCC domain-containing protein [Mucilaginibacter mali]QKJ32764.1 SRPBCC domain-containing protein [Mucilaginibacter mali]
MEDQNFSKTFTVDKTPEEVFNAISNVCSWWTENLEGASQNLNDEFEVRFGDVHYSRQKLSEVIPGKRMVWLITDSKLTFVEDHHEWTGTETVFEISAVDNKTQLTFTHKGLTPKFQCYNGCSSGWTYYINSLHQFIETGKGVPDERVMTV